MNIFVIEALLKQTKTPCDSVNSGLRALDLIKDRIKSYAEKKTPLYEIILLDFSMPGMDGPEVAQRILQLYEDSPHVELE